MGVEIEIAGGCCYIVKGYIVFIEATIRRLSIKSIGITRGICEVNDALRIQRKRTRRCRDGLQRRRLEHIAAISRLSIKGVSCNCRISKIRDLKAAK